MAKTLNPMAIWGGLRELKTAAKETRPLVVSGPLAAQLEKELRAGRRREPSGSTVASRTPIA